MVKHNCQIIEGVLSEKSDQRHLLDKLQQTLSNVPRLAQEMGLPAPGVECTSVEF